MRARLTLAILGITTLGGILIAQAPARQRMNPVIDLLEQGKPVFGLYAPSNRRRACAAPLPPRRRRKRRPKTPRELAKDALAYKNDRLHLRRQHGRRRRSRLPAFTEFVKRHGGRRRADRRRSRASRIRSIVKTPKIAPDPAQGDRQHQPSAQPRRQRHRVRRRRERGRSEARARRDALQVEGRHAARRRGQGAGVLGHERSGVQAEGRSVAAQSRRRADRTGRSSRARKAWRTCARSPR